MLVCSIVDGAARLMGLRRANGMTVGIEIAMGCSALAFQEPIWAAIMFAAAAIDAWSLKRGGYSDEGPGLP